MTIEYTYPEQMPIGATVYGKSFYALEAEERRVTMGNGYAITKEDVPEFCEAMLKLAGYDVEYATIQDETKSGLVRYEKVAPGQALGKQLISILEVDRDKYFMGRPAGATEYINNIIQLIKKECGIE